jgi:hypothetical protein
VLVIYTQTQGQLHLLWCLIICSILHDNRQQYCDFCPLLSDFGNRCQTAVLRSYAVENERDRGLPVLGTSAEDILNDCWISVIEGVGGTQLLEGGVVSLR